MRGNMMKKSICLALGTGALLLTGCYKDKPDSGIVSRRYVHKYGYAISAEDWNSKHYPGQMITHLNNGVCVTSSYENGCLHGPTTQTFPYGQMIEAYSLYNQNSLVKEIRYDRTGMPMEQTVQLSPSRRSVTSWYATGTPMRIEESAGAELLEGQYFTPSNELEARVEKGSGERLIRSREGLLLSKEIIESGYAIRKETYFPGGTPQSIEHYRLGRLHGERRTFAETGEPISIEELVDGELHGLATYFKNGAKHIEISYLHGQRNGLEKRFIDGERLSQEVYWENNKKHGRTTFYADGHPQTYYFYDGEKVSEKRYAELTRLDEMISQIAPQITTYEEVR